MTGTNKLNLFLPESYPWLSDVQKMEGVDQVKGIAYSH